MTGNENPDSTGLPRLFVDADACPVKDEVVRVALRNGLKVFMVANGWMRLDDDPLVERVLVPEGPDVADDWIVEHARTDDVAITADIPLAARLVAGGVHVLGPNGRPFTPDNIGMAKAVRDLKSDLRETGEMTGGNRPFAPQDRSRFSNELGNLVHRLLHARRR